MDGPSARSSRRLVRLLHALPPEAAHALTLRLLPLLPVRRWTPPSGVAVELAGMKLPHPIGLAAGFDKNAVAFAKMLRLGFAWVEAGTVTPRPQAGNPRPRMFRLTADEAVINRLGFNNAGLDAVAARLARRDHAAGIVGVNLGMNRETAVPEEDYRHGVWTCHALADFLTLNVSSPNTPGLRALQRAQALHDLLAAALDERAEVAGDGPRKPILVKVAPDLDDAGIDGVVEVVRDLRPDGLIVSNTTLDRPATLAGAHAREAGGLSGRPLFPRSTSVLARFAVRLGRAVPLVGVGGIASGAHAYAKIRAGATAVQLYTALVFEGPGLVRTIVRDLARLAEADGFGSIGEAVGRDAERLAAARLDRRQHVT